MTSLRLPIWTIALSISIGCVASEEAQQLQLHPEELSVFETKVNSVTSGEADAAPSCGQCSNISAIGGQNRSEGDFGIYVSWYQGSPNENGTCDASALSDDANNETGTPGQACADETDCGWVNCACENSCGENETFLARACEATSDANPSAKRCASVEQTCGYAMKRSSELASTGNYTAICQ